MLDVGCGIGRKTFLLTSYLNADGRYEGLDIVKTGIDWCTERITRKYPHFKFQLIDVCNQHYNPTGRYKASEYRFPFANDSFDFVVLGSVFTHMLTKDMENYVWEVARVLKTGGRCLITYFFLTPDSLRLIEEKASSIDFRYALQGCRVKNKDVPEETVAYDESRIRELYQKHGLKISEPIRYGSWCGRKNALSYQDIVVATKPCRPAPNNRLQPITR
jgi:ubiquinone/menaquinone biosynthesis C-methylase UbiE